MNVVKVHRRDFMKLASAAGAGLVLGLELPGCARGEAAAAQACSDHPLGAFVVVGTDDVVTVYVSKSEMGQGVRTSLPMIIAEELDADWKNVRIRQADLGKQYGRQGTGGSSSIRTMWTPLRQAGAAARAMLVSAAATRWGVDAKDVSAANGVLTSGSKKLRFGEVAEAASKLDVPKDVALKDPVKFTIVGRKANRLDNPDLLRGHSGYGIDVRVPGMLYAVVARSPVFDGKVASFDATKVKAIPGVREVVKIDPIGTDLPWAGVAVVADSTWAVVKGREALQVTWDEGRAQSETTESLRKRMDELSSSGAAGAKQTHNGGDVNAALGSAAKVIEARYEVPFLAHATMEPMNATASVTKDGVEIWSPTQFPDWIGRSAAKAAGVSPEQVKVHVTLLGGAFGRRANPDFGLEAVLVSKAVGRPVHVHWTREDDMQHDYYRPASVHRIRGGVDADGKLVAWHHRMSSPAINAYYGDGEPFESEVGAIADLKEYIPNFRMEYALAQSAVPRGWWRSVDDSVNGFVVSAFLDELAHEAGKDPIEFRLAMLPPGKIVTENRPKDHPFSTDRLRRVIELARDKSGWGTPLPAGRARGFAAWESYFTYAAEVVEVSLEGGRPRVHRVVAAVDCGAVVNPDGVAAQVEGAIVYGLTAALDGEITIDRGRVAQSNFHDYPLLRMSEMPVVEVHTVPSTAAPSGMGEPALPPLAPAVANAVFVLTGKRLRTLPLKVG